MTRVPPLLSVAFLLVLMAPAAASAQTTPLTLDEVLRSSARSAPQIVEALAKVRQADGRALSAEGAFDTVFDVDSKSRVAGYYDGTVVEGRATRPLTGNGGYVYGGYRASRGTFPVYEDQAYTNKLGEAKVGALFALLRDRVIDERRTRRTIAGTEIDVARFEAEMVAVGVQRRAVDAYQAWVAAGLRLRAYRDLLNLAERRRSAIGRLVTLGARPEILLVENDQNLVRRRALAVRAEQDVAGAANALSLYLRDEAGAPVTVSDDRMPAGAGALAALSVAATRAGPVERPDYRAVLARIEQATSRLALAENDLSPRLDLRGEVGKDVGAVGLGGPNRTPLEAAIGFRFSVPLQNRAAKGRVAEARAEIDALGQRGRFLRDQISVEVQGIVIAVGAAERLAAIADEERQLADRLAAAERRRFELGSADFFLVNQREETATDARVRLIDAQARIASARAELAAAVADRDALRLIR
ncbi:multidrug transporter [Sphingomonas sp. Leaf34]|uniref:TolC family protein n=1 Tax=Sphingomonas sp. Leaf34 TaxID=1736216 RepID=UPI0006FA74C7|nr:TolC family protein [Sphingomonas sp. Leaf34]KQN30533.1 multidrug transporter [Sphingomonas sp. Leaf34]